MYRIWKNGYSANLQIIEFYIIKKQFKSAIDINSEISSNNLNQYLQVEAYLGKKMKLNQNILSII